MMAYGNMSAAEKHINKQDLRAYKNYDNTNFSMLPGIKQSSELRKIAPAPGRDRLKGSQSVEVLAA